MSVHKNNGTEFWNIIETDEKQSKRDTIWLWVNVICISLMISSSLFELGIFIRLLPIQFIINALIVIFYKAYIKIHGKVLKIFLYVTRTIAISIFALILMSPIAIMKFKNTPNAYPLKKFAYTYGVGNTTRCRQILPMNLPDTCEDYIFVTQSSIGGLQDYHPSAYLIFHTDSDTLRQYEEHISSLGIAERYENAPKDPKDYYEDDDDDEYKEMMMIQMNRPNMLPNHVYERFCYEISDDLGDSVIYLIDNDVNRGFAPNRGCMFNYESRLVVFWV